MKQKLFLTVILSYIFVFGIDAQFYKIQKDGPVHPLSKNYKFNTRCIKADTVYIYTYYEMGLENFSKAIKTYTRSKDGLTDSILVESGICGNFLYHYSKDNQLLYDHEYYPRYPEYEYTRSDYEYDNVGRLAKITYHLIRPTNATTPDSIKSTSLYDYSDANVQMTDSGYIFKSLGYEHTLDSLGRVTYLKNLKNEDEYVEFVDGKKYRIGDNYYSYTDSSCTNFYRSHTGINMLGMTDLWFKDIHVFNKDGYKKSEISYTSKDGITWNIWLQSEYVYVRAGDNPNNNESIEKSQTKAYGTNGAIIVNCDKNATAQVFNFNGQIIKTKPLTSGENRINISRGFYVVVVGNESFKVFVRE